MSAPLENTLYLFVVLAVSRGKKKWNKNYYCNPPSKIRTTPDETKNPLLDHTGMRGVSCT